METQYNFQRSKEYTQKIDKIYNEELKPKSRRNYFFQLNNKIFNTETNIMHKRTIPCFEISQAINEPKVETYDNQFRLTTDGKVYYDHNIKKDSLLSFELYKGRQTKETKFQTTKNNKTTFIKTKQLNQSDINSITTRGIAIQGIKEISKLNASQRRKTSLNNGCERFEYSLKRDQN